MIKKLRSMSKLQKGKLQIASAENLAKEEAKRQRKVRGEFQNRRAAILTEEAESGGTQAGK